MYPLGRCVLVDECPHHNSAFFNERDVALDADDLTPGAAFVPDVHHEDKTRNENRALGECEAHVSVRRKREAIKGRTAFL